MITTRISEIKIISLLLQNTLAGNMAFVESKMNVPFEIKRIYYLYDVPGGESRGGHGHKNLKQLIIAASGSFDFLVDDGFEKKLYHLSNPSEALYLPAGLWREISNFSSGSTCLVIASEEYSESDYIRNYTEFIDYKKNK